MASREEEKRRRREEREAQLKAEQAKQQGTRRVQLVLAVVLGLAIVGGAIALIAGSGGSESSADSTPIEAKAPIPAVKITDLDEAAKAAECKVQTFESEGRGHTEDPVTYKTNPPTSGAHNPIAAEDGLYEPGNEPTKENAVHSLEHGRILIQYKPGTPRKTIDQLETLGSEPLNGSNGYHVLVFQNNTDMPYEVAATAWTRSITCKTMNDQVFDAIRAFRKAYTDKAPEFIP
jgi:hypothetical protein